MKEIDVGTAIGDKYVLVRLIGAGAMGQVWVARHQALQQPFAVKLMVPPASTAAVQAFEGVETSLRRFKNEAQIAAVLSRKSRHIAQVTDYGIDEGAAYLVMELLEGEGLDRRIGRGRRLDPPEVSAIVSQIAKGLTVAHAEGVTHRDLKPANVFLTRTEDGELLVKLLDFGIAQMARRIVKDSDRAPTRLTMKGLVLGSPAYMSPEQAMAESPDARADVWSLAVLAFEALAGVGPFHGETSDETILRICNFKSTRLRDAWSDASPELDAIFARAFSARIGQRFQTPSELADALAAALPAPARVLSAAAPVAAPEVSPPVAIAEDDGSSLRVPLRPRRIGPALAASAGVALLVGGGLFASRFSDRTARAASAPTASAPASGETRPIAPAVTTAPPAASTHEPAALDVSELPRAKHPASHSTGRHSATAAPESAPSAVPTAAPTAAPTATAKSVDRSAVF